LLLLIKEKILGRWQKDLVPPPEDFFIMKYPSFLFERKFRTDYSHLNSWRVMAVGAQYWFGMA